MVKIAYYDDIISVALFYNYFATHKKMLSYEELENYAKVVNEMLLKVNDDYICMYYSENLNPIYEQYKDENDQLYLKLKKEVDPILERKKRIISLPLDLVVASQSSKALSQIGLRSKQGKILEKQKCLSIKR